MMTDAGYFVAGVFAGSIHFAMLRWNTVFYARGGRIGIAMGLQVVRLAALGCLLAAIALHGALPLLLTTLGILAARPFVMRMLAA